MKNSTLSKAYLIGAICFGMLFFLCSCNKEDDPIVVSDPKAEAEWTLCGMQTTLQSLPAPSYIQFYGDADQNDGMWFSIESTSSYVFENPLYDPDNPFLYSLFDEDTRYSFRLTTSKQSSTELSLDPSVTTMENAEILLKIGSGSVAPVYWESESGSVHIDNYEYIDVNAFKSRGTFTGVFHKKLNQNERCQVSGSWDVYYNF